MDRRLPALTAALTAVVTVLAALAGCGGHGAASPADARVEAVRACMLEVGMLGNPQGAATAASAARDDPAYAKLAQDARAAETSAAGLGAAFATPSTDGTTQLDPALGEALGALADDCRGLGVTVDRPIGGG